MCPQPRGQSLIASARSEKATTTSSGLIWASPNERIPGVSTTQLSSSSGSATDCVEVCRPLPISVTTPTARPAVAADPVVTPEAVVAPDTAAADEAKPEVTGQ